MRVLLVWAPESTCNTLPAQSLIIPNRVISPPPPRRIFHMSRPTRLHRPVPLNSIPSRFLKSDKGKGARDYTSLAHLTEDYQRAVGEGFVTSPSWLNDDIVSQERDATDRANVQLQEMRDSAGMGGAGGKVDVLNPLG